MPLEMLETNNDEEFLVYCEAQMDGVQAGGGSGRGPADPELPENGGLPERPDPDEERVNSIRRGGQVILYFAQRVFSFRHLPDEISAYPSGHFKGPRQHYKVPPPYWTQHAA